MEAVTFKGNVQLLIPQDIERVVIMCYLEFKTSYKQFLCLFFYSKKLLKFVNVS